MNQNRKKFILFFLSAGLMTLALYYLAQFDLFDSIFISIGASFITFLVPFYKKK